MVRFVDANLEHFVCRGDCVAPIANIGAHRLLTSLFQPTTSAKLDNWSSTLYEPRTLIPAVALTVSTVAGVRLYKTYLRRIPTVNHIKPRYYRRKGIFGQVTSVGDADNFRLFHTPGGRIAGWGILPWKKVPTKREDLVRQTVSTLE